MFALRSRIGPVLGAAALAGLSAAAPAAAAPPADPPQRIIGGENVQGDVPWAAALGGMCSASLIAPEWVLTAKHCATQPGATVSVGKADRTQGASFKVSSVSRSPKSDLALLKLERPVPDAQPARLAAADPAVGGTVAIFGWGRTCTNCASTTILKTAQMKFTRMEKDSVGAPVLYLDKITGSPWKGDSGGPAFVDGIQVGVLWAGNEGRNDAYYSSVANGRDWIRSIAGV
ncbi:serine protease [Pilimelia terevasa]|uniref:Serine protease n=1 Tax=Pilimelia terevasa TaxID=53372 RepID=A0A8J3FKN5_9ACTN|nr:trypsin-like serine protease [Pilimelia terevasa]GGK34134.1 serine protease [Pilimelia terevasa]